MRFPSLGDLLNSDFINLQEEEGRKSSFREEDNVDLENHETKIFCGHPHRIDLVGHLDYRSIYYMIEEMLFKQWIELSGIKNYSYEGIKLKP